MSQPVTIGETPTTIRLDEPAVQAETIVVSGTLEAADRGVADQPIDLQVGDSQKTVQTAEDGSFEGRLPRPAGQSVPVEAFYAADQTNLEPSEATTTITIPGQDSLLPGSPILWAGLAVIGVLMLLIGWFVRRSPESSRVASSIRVRSRVSEPTDHLNEGDSRPGPGPPCRRGTGRRGSHRIRGRSTATRRDHGDGPVNDPLGVPRAIP
ncbi:MAG: hypothetical protein U5K37_05105 [Natrialbaceae archaeon]|nr:hypothetical protein [Natrialbaceae archaeon]